MANDFQELISRAKSLWYQHFQKRYSEIENNPSLLNPLYIRFHLSMNSEYNQMLRFVWDYCLERIEPDTLKELTITAQELSSMFLKNGLDKDHFKYSINKHSYCLEHRRYYASKNYPCGLYLDFAYGTTPFKSGVSARAYMEFIKAFDAMVYRDQEFKTAYLEAMRNIDTAKRKRKILQKIEQIQKDSVD